MGADLTITGLTAGYGRSRVVSGLDLGPLAAGTVTALVGPNAAGKSTLLKALAGLVPAAGSAMLGDVDLLALGPRARAGHFGYLPQTLPAATGLTVLEAVIVALRATGVSTHGTDPARRAMQALDGLGVADLAGRALDRLSGGQRQLVGLAAALVREPPLVLLDEPTSALDLFHQVRVMEASRALAANGRVVVAVLHDLTLAARWSDRVVVLQDGCVAADGPPAEAITPEMLASVYGVAGRVEPCSGGFPQVILDGRLASPLAL